MRNADYPRAHAEEERLLRLDPRTGTYGTGTLADLPDHLRPFDLLVVNDAATLPASLPLRLEDDPHELELRLAGEGGDALTWWAVLFGPGDWHVPTERRPAPPRAMAGDTLWVGPLSGSVLEVSPISPRLVRIRFHQDPEHLYRELYRLGRPVQYSYVRQELELWDVQTRYGARPWALEMPSAGRPLTWDILARAREKGVGLASLTHAAGLSATGDPVLDAALPLPERYDLPQRTVDAIEFARGNGGRVIAVGTSVVRALEGNAAANGGRLRAGTGTVSLVLGPESMLQIVDGLLTGIHEPGTSHFALMEAFASPSILEPALHYADEQGFLQHEFGDSMLIVPEHPMAHSKSSTREPVSADQLAPERVPRAVLVPEPVPRAVPDLLASGRVDMQSTTLPAQYLAFSDPHVECCTATGPHPGFGKTPSGPAGCVMTPEFEATVKSPFAMSQK